MRTYLTIKNKFFGPFIISYNFFPDDNSDEQDDNGDEAGLEEEDELEDEFDDYGNPFQQPPPATVGLNTPTIACSLAGTVVIMRVLRPAAAVGGC